MLGYVARQQTNQVFPCVLIEAPDDLKRDLFLKLDWVMSLESSVDAIWTAETICIAFDAIVFVFAVDETVGREVVLKKSSVALAVLAGWLHV